MAKNSATERELGDLHKLVAETLADAIRPRVTAEGEQVPPDPRYLSAAIKFLKDNDIDACASKGSPLDNLVKALPQFDEDEDSPLPN